MKSLQEDLAKARREADLASAQTKEAQRRCDVLEQQVSKLRQVLEEVERQVSDFEALNNRLTDENANLKTEMYVHVVFAFTLFKQLDFLINVNDLLFCRSKLKNEIQSKDKRLSDFQRQLTSESSARFVHELYIQA